MSQSREDELVPRVSDSRERLIDAAARLLWQQGFHATGLSQILQESGAPKGSLYFHFPGGKEQLCVEALRVSGRRLTEKLEAIFRRSKDPSDALRVFIGLFARQLEKSGFRRGCPVATVTLEASSESEALRTTCNELYAEWQGLIARGLEASGKTREEADSLANLVLSSLEGALILSRARRDVAPVLSLADQLSALV